MRTALYRFFDTAGQLLYVGITTDTKVRWGNHAAAKRWWPDVAHKTVEWHDTREDAEAAERRAIEAEAPLYNVTYATERKTIAISPDKVRELSVSAVKSELANALNVAAVYGQITYITSRGRRIAAIASVHVADAAVGAEVREIC